MLKRSAIASSTSARTSTARHATSPPSTLSEAAKYTPEWKLGVGYEFEQRPDGLPGLKTAYGLRFDGSARTMDLGLLYPALNARRVDVVAGNSTDRALLS